MNDTHKAGFRFIAGGLHPDRLEFTANYGVECDIHDYKDALSFGISWEGDGGFTLSREKVATLVAHLKQWLEKGTLEI